MPEARTWRLLRSRWRQQREGYKQNAVVAGPESCGNHLAECACGQIIAYFYAGFLVDDVFNPLFLAHGTLARFAGQAYAS